MRILCIIENLEPGGAQRQICSLAVLLKKEKWDVSILTYYPHDFFLPMLRENSINYINISPLPKFKRFLNIRKIIRSGCYDVILAYSRTPSFISELSCFPRKKFGLIISERSKLFDSKRNWKLLFHIFADFVIVNSKENKKIIEKKFGFLKDKVYLIYNFLDLECFSPKNSFIDGNEICLLGVGRVSEEKNILNLIKALSIIKNNYQRKKIKVNWYGLAYSENEYKRNKERNYYYKVIEECKKLGLCEMFKIYPPSYDIVDKYRNCTALILPSIYEGLPNVVTEAMACGKPILLSRISDAEELVHDAKNGFLFDPNSVEDIAKKIIMFSELSFEEIKKMGIYSRKRAELLFNKEQYLNSYMTIFRKAAEIYRL